MGFSLKAALTSDALKSALVDAVLVLDLVAVGVKAEMEMDGRTRRMEKIFMVRYLFILIIYNICTVGVMVEMVDGCFLCCDL